LLEKFWVKELIDAVLLLVAAGEAVDVVDA